MPAFFNHVLERVDWTRDLHFQTRTTIDTLDYSGTNLNSGSKVVIAVAGDKKRKLSGELLSDFSLPGNYTNPRIVMPGIIAITGPKFSDQQKAEEELAVLTSHLKGYDGINLHGFPLIFYQQI